MKTLPRSGRPRLLDNASVNRLAEEIRNSPFTTSSILKENLQLRCSASTILRRLHERELHSRCPARKPQITQENANTRLEFSRVNLERDWTAVIFSDEKTFVTSAETKKVLWRPNNTRYLAQHIQPNKRSGRISAAYWGWMSHAGPGELVRVNRRFSALDYVQVLEDVMLPSVRVIYPDGPILFVQDNSPIHTARIVREWFADHNEIINIQWPARSPDLNPIENLWAAAVRQWQDLENVNVRNENELHNNIMAVWERLRTTNICENLVNSMSRRLLECIESEGFYTRY